MNPYAGPNLTIDQVRRIVAVQFPDLAASEVAFTGNGGDFDVLRVAGRWMFRFPKGPDREQCLLQEIALLEVIGPQLPIARAASQCRHAPTGGRSASEDRQ